MDDLPVGGLGGIEGLSQLCIFNQGDHGVVDGLCAEAGTRDNESAGGGIDAKFCGGLFAGAEEEFGADWATEGLSLAAYGGLELCGQGPLGDDEIGTFQKETIGEARKGIGIEQ